PDSSADSRVACDSSGSCPPGCQVVRKRYFDCRLAICSRERVSRPERCIFEILSNRRLRVLRLVLKVGELKCPFIAGELHGLVRRVACEVVGGREVCLNPIVPAAIKGATNVASRVG